MNDTVKDMLVRHEGLRLRPYLCPAGRPTIGIGHNYGANPLPSDIASYLKENGEITDSMAYRLLNQDVNDAYADCLFLYPGFRDFTENRQNALIDWMFNVGLGTAQQFHKTNAAINEGRWADAAEEMQESKWFTQVKSRAVEICGLIREG